MRSPGRRRRIPRSRTYGKEWGEGRREEDALSGWEFPVRLMRRTEAGLVSIYEADGSVDKPDTW